MMQSNNPYNRVDEGIGSGLVAGAVVGGASMAGLQFGGTQAARGLRNMANPVLSRNAAARAIDGGIPKMATAQGVAASGAKHLGNGIRGARKMAFGGGRNKLLSYGVGALGGAAIGGIADGMN
ncbi:hypothetical protein TCA2_4518 [Paenibacillus sp. TCA20]|uniref:hypothetical protein n=1 Tax=Paenibacillus sp. TCA20 TaxID=1499968 RepID=UPI0004D853BF|nr:hypothetical protein [Paenibacillus sp. TCA20]GAK42026.1 hypothetical protein TCA2_4518 [Paenibacillus sp. TCA20]